MMEDHFLQQFFDVQLKVSDILIFLDKLHGINTDMAAKILGVSYEKISRARNEKEPSSDLFDHAVRMLYSLVLLNQRLSNNEFDDLILREKLGSHLAGIPEKGILIIDDSFKKRGKWRIKRPEEFNSLEKPGEAGSPGSGMKIVEGLVASAAETAANKPKAKPAPSQPLKYSKHRQIKRRSAET